MILYKKLSITGYIFGAVLVYYKLRCGAAGDSIIKMHWDINAMSKSDLSDRLC